MGITRGQRFLQTKVLRMVPMRRPDTTIGSNALGQKGPLLTTSGRVTRERSGIAFWNSEILIIQVIRIGVRQVSVINKDKKGVGSLPLLPGLFRR